MATDMVIHQDGRCLEGGCCHHHKAATQSDGEGSSVRMWQNTQTTSFENYHPHDIQCLYCSEYIVMHHTDEEKKIGKSSSQIRRTQ